MRQYIVVDGKRYQRTYAESIKVEEIEKYLNMLQDDGWKMFVFKHCDEPLGHLIDVYARG